MDGGDDVRRVNDVGLGSVARGGAILVLGLLCVGALSGCLMAGYSSTGGGFIWPGGLGFLVLLGLLFFFLRGRR
jgi:hypothetical protein